MNINSFLNPQTFQGWNVPLIHLLTQSTSCSVIADPITNDQLNVVNRSHAEFPCERSGSAQSGQQGQVAVIE